MKRWQFVVLDTPEDGCSCRKPRPGLFGRAAKELDFDLQASLVSGDKAADIRLGRQVRATTFLARTGYRAEFVDDPAINPDYVADDLAAAAQLIQRLVGASETRLDHDH